MVNVAAVRTFMQSKTHLNILLALLVIYAILLGTESYVSSSWQIAYVALEWFILMILTVDIIARVTFDFHSATRSGWWWVDVSTTLIGFIPGCEALRAVRLFQLASRFEKTRVALEELLAAIKRAMPIVYVFIMVCIINSLIGHRAFAEILPEKFGSIFVAVRSSTFLAFTDNASEVYEIIDHTNVWHVGWVHLTINFVNSVLILPFTLVKMFK